MIEWRASNTRVQKNSPHFSKTIHRSGGVEVCCRGWAWWVRWEQSFFCGCVWCQCNCTWFSHSCPIFAEELGALPRGSGQADLTVDMTGAWFGRLFLHFSSLSCKKKMWTTRLWVMSSPSGIRCYSSMAFVNSVRWHCSAPNDIGLYNAANSIRKGSLPPGEDSLHVGLYRIPGPWGSWVRKI